jgi:hypothetical protein
MRLSMDECQTGQSQSVVIRTFRVPRWFLEASSHNRSHATTLHGCVRTSYSTATKVITQIFVCRKPRNVVNTEVTFDIL